MRRRARRARAAAKRAAQRVRASGRRCVASRSPEAEEDAAAAAVGTRLRRRILCRPRQRRACRRASRKRPRRRASSVSRKRLRRAAGRVRHRASPRNGKRKRRPLGLPNPIFRRTFRRMFRCPIRRTRRPLIRAQASGGSIRIPAGMRRRGRTGFTESKQKAPVPFGTGAFCRAKIRR